MALQAARLPARIDEAGDLVLFDDQDRSRWDERLIFLGFQHFDRSMAGSEVTEYHVQAAIAATHARAADARSVQWPTILELYDQLLEMTASPVVALNRAVAVAKVYGPAAGLDALETASRDPKLQHYHLLLAARGPLLAELGRTEDAAIAFAAALERDCTDPERRFLLRRLAQCRH
jgi:RNA polymerase sigma-70 factor (ECF subfamily)